MRRSHATGSLVALMALGGALLSGCGGDDNTGPSKEDQARSVCREAIADYAEANGPLVPFNYDDRLSEWEESADKSPTPPSLDRDCNMLGDAFNDSDDDGVMDSVEAWDAEAKEFVPDPGAESNQEPETSIDATIGQEFAVSIPDDGSISVETCEPVAGNIYITVSEGTSFHSDDEDANGITFEVSIRNEAESEVLAGCFGAINFDLYGDGLNLPSLSDEAQQIGTFRGDPEIVVEGQEVPPADPPIQPGETRTFLLGFRGDAFPSSYAVILEGVVRIASR